MKLFRKYLKKLIPKLVKQGWTIKGKYVNKEWQFTNKKDFKYKVKSTKKNIFMKFYCKGYRTVQL